MAIIKVSIKDWNKENPHRLPIGVFLAEARQGRKKVKISTGGTVLYFLIDRETYSLDLGELAFAVYEQHEIRKK